MYIYIYIYVNINICRRDAKRRLLGWACAFVHDCMLVVLQSQTWHEPIKSCKCVITHVAKTVTVSRARLQLIALLQAATMVSSRNFDSQNFKLRASNPISEHI